MKPTPEELHNIFGYHRPKDRSVADRHEAIREICLEIAGEFCERLPDCRETEIALSKLEEAMFWAHAAIARNLNR